MFDFLAVRGLVGLSLILAMDHLANTLEYVVCNGSEVDKDEQAHHDNDSGAADIPGLGLSRVGNRAAKGKTESDKED